MNTQKLLEEGFLGTPDAAVQIRESVGDPHSSAGGRSIALTLAGGLSFEVLVERGLDIGSAWAGGQPIAWRAPLSNPGLAPSPAGWLGRFGGGLLTTCGLDNIGAPRAGYGQHGSHHDTRAADVSITRLPASADGGPGVAVSGVIDSVETFGRTVRVYREIEARCDSPSLIIRDRIVNEGRQTAPVALLYHVNIGAPLVLPGSRIEVGAERHEPREDVPGLDDWRTYPSPIDDVREAVWSHEELTSIDGWSRASVTAADGRTATVEWITAQLPRLVQWVFPVRGRWALGLEPANAPLFGPERDADGAGIPPLGPGAEWLSEVRISVT